MTTSPSFARRPRRPRRLGLVMSFAVAMLLGWATLATPVGAPSATAASVGFRLAVDPKAVTVGRGSTTTAAVLLSRTGSFAKAVTLSGSARRGITLRFDENPLSNDDTDVTVSASPTALLGTTTLTLTGKSGRLTARTTLRITVTAGPTPSVTTAPTTTAVAAPVAAVVAVSGTATASPSSLSMAPGSSGNVTVTVTGAVAGTPSTFDITGLPSGVSAAFFPSGNSSAVALTASSGAGVGIYPLLLRASQNGSVYATAAVVLTIASASATPTTPATTTTPTTTTTVSPAAGPTTTVVTTALVGDLVITRKVNQTPPCAAPSTGAPAVSLIVNNRGATPISLRLIPPGSCSESGAPIVVGANSQAIITGLPGSTVVSRSTVAPGLPIVRVSSYPSEPIEFAIDGRLSVALECTDGTFAVAELEDGQSFVKNDLPAGTVCGVAFTRAMIPVGSRTDNDGAPNDGKVVLRGRPSNCPSATPSVTAANPCYAQVTFSA